MAKKERKRPTEEQIAEEMELVWAPMGSYVPKTGQASIRWRRYVGARTVKDLVLFFWRPIEVALPNVTAPRPAPQPAPAATQEEEDDDYAQQRLDGRDYHDDWDRGAPSTAPRSQPAPAPRRRGGFPPIRQSYDDYDRHRAETERIWANADFDEPDRYWQQPPR
ncbi:unnamed protein product [Symbiodinium microadriaticum]|nr:unnamed protein product [Symbiodinium microadriaticum]